jgi:hypothetical protein
MLKISRVCAGLTLAAALMLGATAAAAQDVGYNAMPNIVWSKFKTYKWVKIQGVKYPDDITDTQIKSAVDTQLATKGLTKTEGDADLYVGYQVALDEEKQLNSYSMGGGPGWGWGPGFYGGGYGGGTSTTTSSTIVIGQVGVDMYDPAGQQLLWRGTATKTIDPEAKPEKRQKNLGKAMKKMFKNYPPPAKKD